MKPKVYFDFKECSEDKDSVVIRKDKLKEILDEVYQAGYTDGSADKATITYHDNQPIAINTLPAPLRIDSPLRTDGTIVTCNSTR